jgi:protocatechuate 3,4-dioxygenase, alpha subunit
VRPPTPSQTVGPFFGFALPFESGPDAVESSTLESVRIEGQVLDGAGEPVGDALVEVWTDSQFARSPTDIEGAYHVTVARPGAHGRGAPHLDVVVFARGLLRHLLTRVYFPDEAQANAADPVLNAVDSDRRSTLVARAEGDVLRFDIRLQGEDETVFFRA